MENNPVQAALEILRAFDYTWPEDGVRRVIAHLSRLRPFSAGEPTEGRAFVTYTVEPDND